MERTNGRSSLLDSGEDLEMLEDDQLHDDDLPPLEDKRDVKLHAPDSEPNQSQEEWLDVLGNNQLKKKVVEAGQGHETRPQKLENVKVELKTFLKDGTLVEEKSDLCFTLGHVDFIQALDLTVQLMELEERAVIQTDAKYAYGERGSLDPEVPPNSDLVLEVKLLEVTEAPDLELLPPGEKVALASYKRERGNAHFQRGDFAFAVNSYSAALQVIDSNSKVDVSSQQEDELLGVKVKCLNNMAASQLKLQRLQAAQKSCSLVLLHQPQNVKALYRLGKVLSLQGECSEAVQTLKKALRLEPSNKTIHAELSKLVKLQTEQRGAEKVLYQKMLGGDPLGGDPLGGDPLGSAHSNRSSWTLSWKWLFGATAVALGGVALSVVIAARN